MGLWAAIFLAKWRKAFSSEKRWVRKGLEGFTRVSPGINMREELAFACNSWLWVTDNCNSMNPNLMTNEKQETVLGCSDFLFLPSVIGLHVKHLTAYHASDAGNVIMTQSLPPKSRQSRGALPNLFGTRHRFCGRQFFHGLGQGGWFRDKSSSGWVHAPARL